MIFDLWAAGAIALVMSFYGMFFKWIKNNSNEHDRRAAAREDLANQIQGYLEVHDTDVKRQNDFEEFRRDFE